MASPVVITAGYQHACAIVAPTEIYCWGNNERGQLGIESTSVSERQAPDEAVKLPEGVEVVMSADAIAAGAYTTCVVSTTGEVYCWGANIHGQADPYDDSGQYLSKPYSIPFTTAAGERFASISVGARHVCGLTESNKAYCWGNNYHGALGNDSESGLDEIVTEVEVDTRDFDSFEVIQKIQAGADHTCALTSNDDVYCWGGDGFGELGTAAIGTNSSIPVPIHDGAFGASTEFVEVKTFDKTTCARTRSREIFCWGENSSGQTGDGTTSSPAQTPTKVASDEAFVHVALGVTHGCAVTGANQTMCWGANPWGELGVTAGSDHREPAPPISTSQKFRQLSLGTNFSCGVTKSDDVFCWGMDEHGRLGAGDGDQHTHVPQQVDLP